MEQRLQTIWTWLILLAANLASIHGSAIGQNPSLNPPREFPSQRWLPDGDFSDTRSLLERLQKRNHAPSANQLPKSLELSPEEMRKHAESLLKGLPPDERKRLKSLAQKLQKDGGNRKALEDRLPFSPELMENLRASQELMQLIDELQSEQAESIPGDSSEDEEGIDPFGKRSVPNGITNPKMGNTGATNQTNSSKDGAGSMKSTKMSQSNSDNPSVQAVDSKPAATPKKSSDQATSSSTASNNPSPANSVENRNSSPPRLDRSPRQAPPQFQNDSNPLSNGTSRNDARVWPSNPPRTPDTVDPRKQGTRSARLSSRSRSDQASSLDKQRTPESALEVFQRKLDELGLSTILQKIAKEAVGLEQQSLSPLNEQSESTITPSHAASNSSSARESTPAQPSGSRMTERGQRGIQPIETTTANRSSASNRSSPGEPRGFDFPELALPAWPTFDLRWLIALVLAAISLVATYFFLLESGGTMASVLRRDTRKGNGSIDPSTLTASNRKEYMILFHRMMERMFPRVEDWWTHRTVVTRGFESHPLLVHEMAIASEVYEKARYWPCDIELNPSEIAGACRAIDICLSQADQKNQP